MNTSRRSALMSHFEGDPPSRTPGKECGRGGGSAGSPADQPQAPDVLEVSLVVAIDQPGSPTAAGARHALSTAPADGVEGLSGPAEPPAGAGGSEGAAGPGNPLNHPDREPGEAPAGAVVPSCLSAGARPTAVSLRERHTAVAATGRAVSSPPAPVRPVGTPTDWW